MSLVKVIAFDLDDTLLDTSGLLVPRAAERACQAMLNAGLQCTLEQCLTDREILAKELSHREIFAQIASKYGATNSSSAIEGALKEFYNPQIPDQLPLLPGALKNLEILKDRYSLYLVTMGSLPAQQKKIQSLGIASFFKEIFILDSFKGERKETAFRKIIAQENILPWQLLSVGNRLSSEIRDGKICGGQTCYFAYGEHVGEHPAVPEDQPDVTIFSHKELLSACAL